MINIDKTLIISTSRNTNTEYTFYFTSDISKKVITTTKKAEKYNSRYMEFDLDLDLEEGFGVLEIKRKDELIFTDIYYNQFSSEDTFEYTNTDKKFVYKKNK